MSVERFAQIVMWLATLMLPYLLFVAGNEYTSRRLTALRAGIAIAVGWCLAVAYVTAARAINISIATPAELLARYDRDGAPLAFATVLGWLPATFVVAVAWIVHSIVLPRLRGRAKRRTPRSSSVLGRE